MTDDSTSSELSPEQQEGLRALSRERQPPDDLEQRVVAALLRRGLVRSAAASRQRVLVRLAAAAVALLAVGFLADRLSLEQPTDAAAPAEKFMLLLYDTPEREAARSDEQNRQLAAEYSAWAQEIGRAGHFLDGDPLLLEGRMLRRVGQHVETGPLAPEAGGEIVVGYFMIQAADYDQALEIARQCPHLKYRGGVLVRPVGHG